MNSQLPKKISRFQVVRLLGTGAQGSVYLAVDPTLRRNVAIKTLKLGTHSTSRQDALLAEAQIVSQFSHPNIVTLYDMGTNDGTPFLVFEFVDGKPLSRMLAERGALSPERAAGYTIQVLQALSYAHQKGVVHRDIKPANIMIAEHETARVMDFGIAHLLSSDEPREKGFTGTPQYAAPEYATDRVCTPRSDIFSAGMVLYEMLAGAPAVTGSNLFEVLNRIANGAITPPSSVRPGIPEVLDDTVMKALAREPDQRYESAIEFESALAHFLDPAKKSVAAHGDSPGGVLDFLLRRMQQKADFPALSSTISAVNRAAASDTAGVGGLANSILKDFALTNKLLRLVNTAYYGQFSGTISTISRAVVILGFERVRNIAMTLMLFEHLQNRAQAAALKDEVIATYFSGILARELVSKIALRDGEEAFICGMFHNLGRLLVRFYFHDEGLAIDHYVAQDWEETRACAHVLGITFEDLGLGIARHWNLPDKIIGSMHSVRAEHVARAVNETAKLAIVAELSGELCSLMAASDTDREAAVAQILARYHQAIPVTRNVIADAVDRALKEFSRDASILNINPKASDFYASARKWGRTAAADQSNAPAAEADTVQTVVDEHLLTTGGAGADDTAAEVPAEAQRTSILSAGIQDITNSLVAESKLNDILRIVLETMYRGIGFSRVMLCIRDAHHPVLKARLGYGQDIDQILKAGFNLSLHGAKDVFTAALAAGADIFIENINADRIRDHVPDWYRKMIPAQAFVLFPVIIHKKPVGIFYGDTDRSGWLKFAPEELNLLKTLRNQAVLAIKQQN